MGLTSYNQFRNANNNIFTVSGVKAGHQHALNKYWADGLIQISISRFSASVANAVNIFNFPYAFKIVDASFQQYGMATKAGTSVELYNGTTSNATQYVCGISAAASRSFKRPVTINFNKSEVAKNGRLLVMVEGTTDASCAGLKGMLTLRIRPI